jgi:hypothetical protein
VKPFARPAFLRDSLGYIRYYGFIRPKTALRYFWHFLTGSLPFCLPLQFWFSCSLTEPGQGSCRLNAVCRVNRNQVALTLGLSGSLPLRFWHSKSYFRHFDDGLLAFNSPVHTIALVILTTESYCP